MDLGIAGRKAIVCASSRGLGRACALKLAEAGCEVVVNGLNRERLEATAADLRKATGARITAGAPGGAAAEGQKAPVGACPAPRTPARMAGVGRWVAGSNVTINFLLPGAFDTDRLKGNIEATAKKQGVPYEQLSTARAASIPAKRFGTPDEFGAACAFLCSAQAGYI